MDGFLVSCVVMLIYSAETEAQMNCPTNPDCCDEPDFEYPRIMIISVPRWIHCTLGEITDKIYQAKQYNESTHNKNKVQRKISVEEQFGSNEIPFPSQTSIICQQ